MNILLCWILKGFDAILLCVLISSACKFIIYFKPADHLIWTVNVNNRGHTGVANYPKLKHREVALLWTPTAQQRKLIIPAIVIYTEELKINQLDVQTKREYTIAV